MKKYLWLLPFCIIFGCKEEQASKQHIQNKKVTATNKEGSENAIQNDSYCNARFGYCVAYPGKIMTPQPESENGDGRVFTAPDSSEILRVYGYLMWDPEDERANVDQLKDLFSKDLKDAYEENPNDKLKVTYKKMGKDFFVISGLKKGKIYYQKTIVSKDAFANLIIQYEPKDSVLYNNVSEAVSKSFRFEMEPQITPLYKEDSL